MANVAVAAAAPPTKTTPPSTIVTTTTTSAATASSLVAGAPAETPSDPPGVVFEMPVPIAASSGIGRARGSMKGKHLMRSQALREAASPPRSPSESRPTSSVVVIQTQQPNQSVSVRSSFTPSSLSPTPSQRNPSPKSTSRAIAPDGSVSPSDAKKPPSFLDHEFPKLAQPKSKSTRNAPPNSNQTHPNRDPAIKTIITPAENKKPHLLEVSVPGNAPRFANASSPDKDNRGSTDGDEHSGDCSPDQHRNADRNNGGAIKKGHRGGLYVKGSKPRLKSMGSSASTDEVSSSGFISREESFEKYTDSNGLDLFQFFKETLNKNIKDRNTLVRIEKDLIALAMDRSRSTLKFPPMSSYNRMLIHRVAAYFGMEHNVDATQQCVVAGITKSTRVPEVRFRSLFRDDDGPRKSILKRETQSFDEYRRGMMRCSDHRGMLDRKAKSFEEREEEYERAKLRIFKKRELEAAAGGDRSASGYWPQWGASDSCSDQEAAPEHSHGLVRSKSKNSHRMLKVQSLSVDNKPEGRPPITKSNSFGGYGPGSGMHKGHSGSRLFCKQDSLSTSWRLSPSSSGYKTQTQSIRSDSVTPSPTGYESGGEQTPEPLNACGVVWAVTDMAAVPPGSVLIDPQTLQPMTNKDGSIYHFDPENLPEPPNPPPPSNHRKKMVRQKSQRKYADQIENDGEPKGHASRTIEDVQENYTLDNYATPEYDEPPTHQLQIQQIESPPIHHCLDLKSCEITQENILEAAALLEQELSDDESLSDTNNRPIGELHVMDNQPALLAEGTVTPVEIIPVAADEGVHVINDFSNATGSPGSQFSPLYHMDNKTTSMPKAVHYVTYQPQDPELSGAGYLVPIYEPMVDGQPLHQPGAAGYPSPNANMASTILPIAYSPQIFPGGLPHLGPPQGSVGSTGAAQLIYAAGSVDTSTVSTAAVAASANQLQQHQQQQQQHHYQQQQHHQQQYITFPMGYPYPYSDSSSYHNYWANNMAYYVPQAIASDPHLQSPASMPAIHYPNVVQSAYPSPATNPNYPQPKRGTPPQSQHHLQHQQMSSAQPFSNHHFSPNGGAMIFSSSAPASAGAIPYVETIKALYPVPPQSMYTQHYHHSISPPQSNTNSPPQCSTSSVISPVVSSPTPVVASSVNIVTRTTSTSTSPPMTNSSPPPISSSINIPVVAATPPNNNNTPSTFTPNNAAKPTSTVLNPASEPYSPPATYRKPFANNAATAPANNRFSNENTSHSNPRRAHNSESLYNNGHMSYQSNKFKPAIHIQKRTYDQPQHHTGNYHSYQSPHQIAATSTSAGSSFRHANPSFADKFRPTGPRPRPPNLDLRRSGSIASVGPPSATATDSPKSNGSGNSGEQPQSNQLPTSTPSPAVTSQHIPHTSVSGGATSGAMMRVQSAYNLSIETASIQHQLHQHQQQQQHRHQQQQASFYSATAAAAAAAAAANAMGSAYGGTGSPGMYVKLGGAFFTHHPSISFANHQRAKVYTKDIRPQFGHHNQHQAHHQQLSDILPAMNMMLSARNGLMNPRSSNPSGNYRNMRPR